MELLLSPFLVQQSPLVEADSSLLEKKPAAVKLCFFPGRPRPPPGTPSPLVPRAAINRAVPWPQPESTGDRPKGAIAPLKRLPARQPRPPAFHLVGDAQELLNLLSWLC